MAKKKQKSVTEQMVEEMEKIKMMKEVQKEIEKGVSVKLSLENHLLLVTVSDFFDAKIGKFASELLVKSLQSIAHDIELGEWDSKTGEFELYTEEELENFKKESK